MIQQPLYAVVVFFGAASRLTHSRTLENFMDFAKRMLTLFGAPLLVCALFVYLFQHVANANTASALFTPNMLVVFMVAMLMVVNLGQTMERNGKSFSLLALLTSFFGLGMAGILFVPTLDSEAVARGSRFIYGLFGASLSLTLLSGIHRVSRGHVLKRGARFLVEGERCYFLPLLMSEPLLVPMHYEFATKRALIDGDDLPFELCVTFSCDVDPREDAPLVVSKNAYSGAVGNSVETIMKRVCPIGQRITVQQAVERLLPLRSQTQLPNLGNSAKMVLKQLTISTQ